MAEYQKHDRMPAIRLLLADVDGTLLTRKNVLSPNADIAVRRLAEAGIDFSIITGRCPAGIKPLVRALNLTRTIAVFNGALFLEPATLSPIVEHLLSAELATAVIKFIEKQGLDVWVFRRNEWLIRKANGAYVRHERFMVGLRPIVVADFIGRCENIAKIVGVSADRGKVSKCEEALRKEFQVVPAIAITAGKAAACWEMFVARSQPYYVDITHPQANKGDAVAFLSRALKIPREYIATMGDMPNDLPMFAQSGISIAMGQADDRVKDAATFVTIPCEEAGFSYAIDHFLLSSR